MRILRYILRLFMGRRKAFKINSLPVGFELTERDRSALYGEVRL